MSATGLPRCSEPRSSAARLPPLFLSYGCGERWLHVNNDWAVLEPVDADHRPIPPGEQSQTVLVSNLANHVQPFCATPSATAS